MTLIAIVLLTMSALIHATWNLISKQNNSSAGFFLVANAWGALLLLPVALFFWQSIIFPEVVWRLVVATGLFQAIYFSCLAMAYQNGNISIAYPLVRSSPVLVVSAVSLLLGQGDSITGFCIAGAVLVVAGCFFVPMEQFSSFSLKNYLNATCVFALAAAVGTTGYSIIDDRALAILVHEGIKGMDIIWYTLFYAFNEALFTVLWLGVFVVTRKNRRKKIAIVFQKKKAITFAAGAFIYLTYLLVLSAMLFVDNVSYVVGFRQMSIPIGVFLGATVLKERVTRPKIYGIIMIVTGLILLGIG